MVKANVDLVNMEEKKIYDLSEEACPMNLVKFKYYYNLGGSFTALLSKNQEAAIKNIISFLNFKQAKYTIINGKNTIELSVG